MSDMKVQGEFEMDTTQGDQAFARVEAGARRMGQSVQQAGEQAGRGVEAIGRGAEKAVKDTERANSSMLSIIRRGQMETQRAIVESSGYTKGSAEGLEELARLRGGDVTAIQGQLVALRQLKSEHETLLASQRESASATLFDQQHQAAKRLVQDADYVRLWTTELAKKEAAEREAAASQLFEREHQAARKLAQDSEYVRMWTAALDQKEAAERKAASQDSFIASLKSQSDAIGKTRADLLELQAAQMGMSAQASPFIAKLREAEGGLGKLGASAGQTKAALAQLPMQFSDIVVSLQGGQAPLTVFLQQGAQIKDSFGGAGAAVKAVGGYALGLVNPFTAVAAAVAVLALGYYKGTQEADNYTRSLLLTGNAAGTTASQMQDMARRVGDVAGTQANAASVLAELAGTGKVAGANLERFTLTAVNMERNVGVAVKETVKDFAELGAAPVEASKKLNEQYGYLTTSIYEQIKALDKEGDALGAATLAQEAYDAGMVKVSAGMEQRLGYLQRGWNAVGEAAGWAWDKMLNVGRPDSMSDKLSAAQKNLEAAQRRGPLNDRPEVQASWQKGIDRLRAEIALLSEQERAQKAAAEAEAARTQAEKDGIAAVEAVTRANERGLTAQQRVNKELAAYRKGLEEIRATNPASALLDSKTIAQTEAWIRQNGQKGQKGQNSGQSELTSIRAKVKAEEEYIQRLREHGAAADKLTEGEKLATKIQEQLDGKLSAKARTLKELELVEAKRLATANKTRIAEEEQIKLDQKHAADYDKQIEAIYASAESTRQNAATQEAANASFGKSKTAIEEMTLATQKNRLANLESLGLTGEHTDALKVQIAEQERYVKSLRGADYKAQSAHTDELLRAAKEQAALYEDEARLVGLSALERSKVVALRQIELKYAKELAQVDLMADGTAEQRAAKEAQRLKVLEAKQIESSAVVAKVVEEDWAKTSQLIGDTLADYIMGGGKDAAQYLKRLFATLVLQPIVQTAVGGLLGAGPGAASGGSNALGTANSVQSMWSSFSGGITGSLGTSIAGLGATLGSTAATAFGSGIVTGGQMGLFGGALGHGAAVMGSGVAGGTAAGLGTMAGAALPWITGAAALLSVIKSMDDSGTPHSGSGAVYSKATGVQSGAGIYNQSTFGMGHRDEYSDAMQAGISGIAQGLGQTLDAFAVSFGKTAGYSVATAFADDSSKDGAWGSLKIMDELGNKLVDWSDNRSSKWAPREFADGEEGYKQYLAAIAKDTRQVLLDMDLPSWADTLLESIGDTADMAALSQVVAQIGVIQTAFVQLGRTIDGFAGMSDKAFESLMKASGGIEALAQNAGSYYENFYSEEERMAKTAAMMTEELAKLGAALPGSMEAYRALTEQQLAAGEGGAELAAKLLQLNGAFAQTSSFAEAQAQAVLARAKEQADAAARAEEAAARDAQSMAEAMSGLQIKLLRAQGNEIAAVTLERQREIAAMSEFGPAAQDMQRQIWQIEDARAARDAQSMAEAMSGGLQIKLLRAQGNEIAAVTLERQREIAAMSEFGPAAQDMQRQIWQIEDARAALERAVQAERKSATASQQAASERVSALESIFDTLKSSIADLYQSAESTAAWSAAQANAFIDRSLEAARASGYLPEPAELAEAIRAAISGIDGTVYGSEFERQRAQLVLAGRLSELKDVSGEQLSTAELQLRSAEEQIARLDSVLDQGGAMLDAIGSGTAATLSVKDAMDRLASVIQAANGAAPGDVLTAGGGGAASVMAGDDAFNTAWLLANDSRNTAYRAATDDHYSAKLSLIDDMQAYRQSARLNTPEDRAAYQQVSDKYQSDLAALTQGYYSAKGAADSQFQQAVEAAREQKQAAQELVLAVLEESAIKVPGFATGGDHKGGLRVVGERGWELEATGPARIWNQQQLAQAITGGGQNTARLESLVQKMSEEISVLRQQMDTANRYAQRTADAVNGRPEAPMIVEMV